MSQFTMRNAKTIHYNYYELYYGKRSDDYKAFDALYGKEIENQPVNPSSINKPRHNELILQRSYSLVKLS